MAMTRSVSNTAQTVNRQASADTPGLQRSFGVGRLSVVRLDGVTRLSNLYQQGCAKLRVPTRHHGDGLEAVMINTSGGMTGGDQLEWNFDAGPQTTLTLTTQASEKIYKSPGGQAQTAVTMAIGNKAKLAWLPQEAILFDRSALQRRIEVDLASDSEALFVEPVILGRTAMGETISGAMTEASLNDRWRIRRGGKLLHMEAMSISGDIPDLINRKAVTGGSAAFATVLVVSPKAEALLNRARQLIGSEGGASVWNGKLLARLVSPDGYSLRKALVPLINYLNPCGAMPRAWSQ